MKMYWHWDFENNIHYAALWWSHIQKDHPPQDNYTLLVLDQRSLKQDEMEFYYKPVLDRPRELVSVDFVYRMLHSKNKPDLAPIRRLALQGHSCAQELLKIASQS